MNAVLDLAGCVARIDTRVDRSPGVEATPGRDRGRPVSARNLSDVDVDGVLEFFEVAHVSFAIVPAGFEISQRLDQLVGGLDRIGTGRHLARVNGAPAHVDAKPDHAGVCAHQHVFFGLGDQRRFSAITAHQARERAVSRALLLGDRLQMDGCSRLEAEPSERVEREDVGGEAGFHVSASPPV